jgi:hypothetical protein
VDKPDSEKYMNTIKGETKKARKNFSEKKDKKKWRCIIASPLSERVRRAMEQS